MRYLLFLVAATSVFTSCTFLYGDPLMSNTYYVNSHKVETQKFKKTNTLMRYDYTDANLKYFKERGYVVIGYTAIRHPFIGIQDAVKAGLGYGATVLLYKHEYVGTASGTAVLPWYSPGETYTVIQGRRVPLMPTALPA